MDLAGAVHAVTLPFPSVPCANGPFFSLASYSYRCLSLTLPPSARWQVTTSLHIGGVSAALKQYNNGDSKALRLAISVGVTRVR